MPDLVQGPGAARQNAGTAAENAQLDAQLELAAKKAALRSLEAQPGVPSADGEPAPPPAPLEPGGRRSTVTIEQNGKTTVFENPTAQQLSQVGIGSTSPPVDGWQLVAMTGSVMFGIVAVVYLLLGNRRRANIREGAGSTPELTDRMSRIENAIETVAVEVERVSESQRYLSRMLSEGAAQPVAQGAQGERVARMNGEG